MSSSRLRITLRLRSGIRGRLALLDRWLAVPLARIAAHPTGTHRKVVCALRLAVVRIDAARFGFDPGFLVAPERSFAALHDLTCLQIFLVLQRMTEEDLRA